MLVEIQYHDNSGSCCPFCGTNAIMIKDHDSGDANDIFSSFYEWDFYTCSCPSGHLWFVSNEFLEFGDKRELQSTYRQFVFYQDWEDHIDMTITAGAFEVPLLDDEDDSWLINRTLQQKLEVINQKEQEKK
jgi:hypothetical protein